MKWLSPPVVAVSLELSETLTEQDVVLDLPCDAFDDGRPAVAGGALVALVCWPEVGLFIGDDHAGLAGVVAPRLDAPAARDGRWPARRRPLHVQRRGRRVHAGAAAGRVLPGECPVPALGPGGGGAGAPTASAFREAVDVAVPEAAEGAQREGESALVLVVGGDLAAVLALLAAARRGRARRPRHGPAHGPRRAARGRRAAARGGERRRRCGRGCSVEVRVGGAGRDAASVLRGRRADLLIMDPFDDRGALRRDTRAVAAACWRGALRFDAKVVPRRCRVRCCLVADAGANGDWARYGLPSLGTRLTEAVDVADDDLCDRGGPRGRRKPRRPAEGRALRRTFGHRRRRVRVGGSALRRRNLPDDGARKAASASTWPRPHVASRRRPVDLRILAPRRCVKNGVERLAVSSSGAPPGPTPCRSAPADAVWRVLPVAARLAVDEVRASVSEESPRGASHCDAVYALARELGSGNRATPSLTKPRPRSRRNCRRRRTSIWWARTCRRPPSRTRGTRAVPGRRRSRSSGATRGAIGALFFKSHLGSGKGSGFYHHYG